MIQIILIDDDCLVATSLKTILESYDNISVVAIGSDGMDAIALYDQYHPDLCLMDIQMQSMNGLDAAAAIIKKYPDAKILLLTTFSDDEYIVKSLKIGTKGYLLKQDYQSLLPAILAVNSGQSVYGTEIVSKLPNLLQTGSSFSYADYEITDRELDVICQIADGKSNKEIAESLFLSEGTVRNYLSQILDKLHLRDRTQLAIFYYQHK